MFQTYQLIVEILGEFDFSEMTNTRWLQSWLKIFGTITCYFKSKTNVSEMPVLMKNWSVAKNFIFFPTAFKSDSQI